MKLLHTSDWHLGKKIEGKQQNDDQALVLSELYDVAVRENVDVVVVAGDVFDTAVPPADAEELFYDTAVKFAEKFIFIVIAGNHDDAVRLCAARALAKKHGMVLCGDRDNSAFTFGNITGGDGFVTVEKNGEKLNLALLPYPYEGSLPSGEAPYAEKVEGAIKECCKCFKAGEYNAFVSHLFMTGSENEESTLGGAKLIPVSALPDCDYVALGHIHKCMKVKDNAWYSGSLLPYHFDDKGEKGVNVVEFGEKTTVKTVPLTRYKKMVRLVVTSFDEAIEKLAACSDKAEVVYKSSQPLDARMMTEMKKYPAFIKLTVQPEKGEDGEEYVRRNLSPAELFTAYYKQRKGEEPTSEMVELFTRALSGDDFSDEVDEL